MIHGRNLGRWQEREDYSDFDYSAVLIDQLKTEETLQHLYKHATWHHDTAGKYLPVPSGTILRVSQYSDTRARDEQRLSEHFICSLGYNALSRIQRITSHRYSESAPRLLMLDLANFTILDPFWPGSMDFVMLTVLPFN